MLPDISQYFQIISREYPQAQSKIIIESVVKISEGLTDETQSVKPQAPSFSSEIFFVKDENWQYAVDFIGTTGPGQCLIIVKPEGFPKP